MYPVSAAFKEAVRSSHVAVARAEVWGGDTVLETLPVQSGTVRVDARSVARRTADCAFWADRHDTSMVPTDGFSALAPFGNELRLYRGVRFSDGTEELVPLGVFIMTDVVVKESASGVEVRVAGVDRSWRVSTNPWTSAYSVPSADLAAAVSGILTNRWADIPLNFPTSTGVTIASLVLGTDTSSDPWKDAVSIAEKAGYDLFFDADGYCRLEQFPSLDVSGFDAEYADGDEAVITEITRSISTWDTYNGLIFTVESSATAAIRAEVYDEDPESPTYRYGAFGQRTKFLSTTTLLSSASATTAAALLLNRYIGAQEVVSWTQIVNPAHDANDLVYVENVGTKLNRVIILDTLSVPLEPEGLMTAQARTVRVIGSGQIAEG